MKNGNNNTNIRDTLKPISDMKSGTSIGGISTIVGDKSCTLSETVHRLPKKVGAVLGYTKELVNAILRSPERLDTLYKVFTHVGILSVILKQ